MVLFDIVDVYVGQDGGNFVKQVIMYFGFGYVQYYLVLFECLICLFECLIWMCLIQIVVRVYYFGFKLDVELYFQFVDMIN